MTKSLAHAFALASALMVGACTGSEHNAMQSSAQDQSGSYAFKAQTLADALEHPWSLAQLPNGDILITERPGRLRVVQDGKLRAQAIAGTPRVFNRNQGGLFDVLLDPNFANNRRLYLSYAAPCDGGGTTAVISARLDRSEENGYRLSDRKQLIVADACRDGGRHFGGRMAFDNDGLLYLSVGDRGHRDDVQDPHNHLGSVLRLTRTGEPAAGNPFADGIDGDPAVFTYGHRNPQGMARHPETGRIWTHEHGPRGGDEVNRLDKGTNYGWPEVTHGQEYSGGRIGPESAPGFADPMVVWVPSIAPSGMHFVQGEPLSAWQGQLLVGALAGQHVARLAWSDEQDKFVKTERLLEDRFGRIRAVGQLDDGALYLLTDTASGELIRLEPTQP